MIDGFYEKLNTLQETLLQKYKELLSKGTIDQRELRQLLEIETMSETKLFTDRRDFVVEVRIDKGGKLTPDVKVSIEDDRIFKYHFIQKRP